MMIWTSLSNARQNGPPISGGAEMDVIDIRPCGDSPLTWALSTLRTTSNAFDGIRFSTSGDSVVSESTAHLALALRLAGHGRPRDRRNSRSGWWCEQRFGRTVLRSAAFGLNRLGNPGCDRNEPVSSYRGRAVTTSVRFREAPRA